MLESHMNFILKKPCKIKSSKFQINCLTLFLPCTIIYATSSIFPEMLNEKVFPNRKIVYVSRWDNDQLVEQQQVPSRQNWEATWNFVNILLERMSCGVTSEGMLIIYSIYIYFVWFVWISLTIPIYHCVLCIFTGMNCIMYWI